mgnify:CR=1 FL=1
MSRQLSFGWTVPALLAGRKTRTTRAWSAPYAMLFRVGETIDAWDRSPKYDGRRVARLRVTRDSYPQNTRHMPDDAYEREGFAFLDEQGWRPLPMALAPGTAPDRMWRALFERWRASAKDQWVVEFVLISREGN